ncbi:MAG: transglutaminase family protein [Betaproteobacteria bacterium]|nr:transglutaminase family protein [Betaproteobacteria bacterium]MBP6644864.1 transglutaminase family protein [Burkholderiaceae bacterium]
MKLQVTHETHYDYQPVVETAQHMAHLQPRDTDVQKLLSHSLQISPEPAQQSLTTDLYGNTRCFFSLQMPHHELRVVADSVVVTSTPLSAPDDASGMLWEQARDLFRYKAGCAYDSASEFVFASPGAPRHQDFVDYARSSFGAGRSLFEAAIELMERVHTEFTYQSQSTEVDTTALAALSLKKGVCQDFAHILIACLRSFGLPARYVSGYLLTEPPPGEPRLIGSDASHAWVSVYLPAAPGSGTGRRIGLDRSESDAPSGMWCDLDPTNNRWGFGSPGEDYVTLALGRDYFDVSPMRGMIHGGTRHVLSVGVTVQPVP